jgi:hypothetical protein
MAKRLHRCSISDLKQRGFRCLGMLRALGLWRGGYALQALVELNLATFHANQKTFPGV